MHWASLCTPCRHVHQLCRAASPLLPAQEPPSCPILMVATASANSTQQRWQVLFLMWSHYCICWTIPPARFQVGLKWILAEMTQRQGQFYLHKSFCGGEDLSLSDRLTVIYKSHTFVNQNLQVLPITWWRQREATDVTPLKLPELILQHGVSMASP